MSRLSERSDCCTNPVRFDEVLEYDRCHDSNLRGHLNMFDQFGWYLSI